MEGNYESDFQGDLPYVALELDILDVHGMYKAVCFHLEKYLAEIHMNRKDYNT